MHDRNSSIVLPFPTTPAAPLRPRPVAGPFLRTAPRPPSSVMPTDTLAWLAEFALRPADLTPFGREFWVRPTELLARHRDAHGQGVGWEVISHGPRFRHQGSKGLFASPQQNAGRLVLADGPLPVLALSALKGPARDTVYAAAGGVWTAAADEAAHALVAKRRITTVVLAFAENEHGRRSRELAAASIAAATPWVELEEWLPHGRDWLEDLRTARRGAGA